MKINRVRIDKTVDYPTSFYKRLKKEQKQFKEKIDSRPKKDNNYINETNSSKVITQKSSIEVNNVQMTETEMTSAETMNTKKLNTGIMNTINTENRSADYEIDDSMNEVCVIEEIDCKQILLSIGYVETVEDEEKEIIIKTEKENIIEELLEGTAEENIIEELLEGTAEENIIEEQLEGTAEENIIEEQLEGTAEENIIEELLEGTAEENIIEEQLVGIAEEEIHDMKAEVQSTDDHLDTCVEIPEFNIKNYFSSYIIGTAIVYDDEDEICEVTDENPEEAIIYKNDDIVIPDKFILIEEDKIEDEKSIIDNNDISEEKNSADICNINNNCNNDIVNKGKKNKYRNINQMKEKLSLVFGNMEKIVRLDDLHIKNKLGFISLLSLFGLLGIFTENKVYLGFFAFLYYVRYLFVLPDKFFKDNIRKAAVPAFFISIAISLMTIILEALFNNTKLLLLGIGISTVIPILFFTIVLAVYQIKKNNEDHL